MTDNTPTLRSDIEWQRLPEIRAKFLDYFDQPTDENALRIIKACRQREAAALLAAQPAAQPDLMTDVAIELEQQRALKIVDDVHNLRIGGRNEVMPTAFQAGHCGACEEIEHRLRTEQWELLGQPAPLPGTVAAQPAVDTPVIAYEFLHPNGHAIVDYTEHTHVGHLTAEKGYVAKPLVYAAPAAVPVQPEGESYEDIWNALQRIDSAAALLPTYAVRHEGGIAAFTQNIVDAIAALASPPALSAMVNRFLGWRLPETFGPDCFIFFDRVRAKMDQSWPIGTNLLTATEARAMLEHVLAAPAAVPVQPTELRDAAQHLLDVIAKNEPVSLAVERLQAALAAKSAQPAMPQEQGEWLKEAIRLIRAYGSAVAVMERARGREIVSASTSENEAASTLLAHLSARPAVLQEPVNSIDHAQRIGHLPGPDHWQEICRTYRCRMNEYDIRQMAKLRTYIEEGLLVVVRPTVATQPAQPESINAQLLAALKDLVSCKDIDAWGAALAAIAAAEQAQPEPAQPADALDAAVRDVLAELERATRKFPTWPTDPLHALAVLGEEFGELTKDVLQLTYEAHKTDSDSVRTEAIQTAAMALRFVMSLDRYEYKPCAQHSQQVAMRAAMKEDHHG
jgi:hypothetical protein